MTSFIASVSPDIPWHVTAFYATYRMTDRHDTTANMLTRAAQIGRAQGLRFVYAGNLPGDVGQLEHTHCPTCEVPVIERRGYDIGAYRLTAAGHCGSCGAKVPGRWGPDGFATARRQSAAWRRYRARWPLASACQTDSPTR